MSIKHLKTNGYSSYISKNMQNKIKTDIYTHTHRTALFMLSPVKYSSRIRAHESSLMTHILHG